MGPWHSARRDLYRHVLDQGASGSTCDEAEVATGIAHQTASARFTAMVSAGSLVWSGRMRPTARGHPARVYVANDHAGDLIGTLFEVFDDDGSAVG